MAGATEPKWDFFLSYAGDDKCFVASLKTAIAQRYPRITIFDYRSEHAPGVSLRPHLTQAICESSHVLCFVSSFWNDSDSCRFEAKEASAAAVRANREDLLIPIVLNMPSSGLPEVFDSQKIRFDCSDHGVDSLISEIIAFHQELFVKHSYRRYHEEVKLRLVNEPVFPQLAFYSFQGALSLFRDTDLEDEKVCNGVYPFSRWLANYSWRGSVSLFGEHGSGKSTILKRLFIEEGLSRRIGYFTADDAIYLDQLQTMTCSTEESFEVLFFDAIDEIAPEKLSLFIDFICKLIANGRLTVWIACRLHTWQTQIRCLPKRIDSRFSHCLQLKPWTWQRHGRSYVEQFAKNRSEGRVLKQVELFYTTTEDQPQKRELFLGNPFRLTLLLILLSERRDLSITSGLTELSLYRQFCSHWAGQTSTLSAKARAHALQEIAKQLFINGFRSIGFHSLEPTVCPREFLEAIKSSGLLKLEETRDPESRIAGFLHQSLTEFFVAEGVLEALRSGGDQIRQILPVLYTYQINQFVRQGLDDMENGDQFTISKNLELAVHEFRSELRSAGASDARKIKLSAEQAVYYLGRTSFPPENARRLETIYFDAGNWAEMRRIAAIGAMLHGVTSVEKHFLETCGPGTHNDVINRSLLMVYLGDATQSQIEPFRDDGRSDCSRAMQALVDRLRSNSPRSLRLRLWDLRTIRCFLVIRERNREFMRTVKRNIERHDRQEIKLDYSRRECAREEWFQIDRILERVDGP